MYCDVCGSDKTIVKDYNHTYKTMGKDINVTTKRRFCSNCNSLVYDKELDNETLMLVFDIYRRLYGIDKDEIINLRKKYNLSLEQFSKILGCEKKTLISYEKGTSIPNDDFMKVFNSLKDNPSLITSFINDIFC